MPYQVNLTTFAPSRDLAFSRPSIQIIWVLLSIRVDDRNVPFIVISSYGEKYLGDPVFRDVPLVKKPYNEAQLVRTLSLLDL